MTRKTAAIALQIGHSQLASYALYQARLIDFDTGSAELTEQHKGWLRQTMLLAAKNSMYRIRLVGYASKLDDSTKNSTLSYNRINTTLKFMQTLDRNAMDRTEAFYAAGEDGYLAAANDNSPEWRAVEVHVFIGDNPPPPPPQLRPAKHSVPPLPGDRYTEWEIAPAGGAVVGPGAVGGFNVYVINNPKRREQRAYMQPVGGIGFAADLNILKKARDIVKQIVTGIQSGPLSFNPVRSTVPVTWAELESSLVHVSGGGVGVVLGYSASVVTFTAAYVYIRSPQGNPVRSSSGIELFSFVARGLSFQLGFSLSSVVGPIARIPG